MLQGAVTPPMADPERVASVMTPPAEMASSLAGLWSQALRSLWPTGPSSSSAMWGAGPFGVSQAAPQVGSASFADAWAQALGGAWAPAARSVPGRLEVPPGSLAEYVIDAWQRSILFLDVLRQRGDTYVEREKNKVACVLSFPAELVLDGATFDRPVNYALNRVIPPADQPTLEGRRPFVVFDPRAGHGPGIGGMKADSAIGVILAGGHPCYFVSFQTEPVPGQTVEDVARAQMRFVAEVAARHPDAEGKPCLIGNCQAGWQLMIAAALNPDIPGPIMLAGAPMSYWAGVRGHAPLRYLGGLLGGTWMTALAGDLGNGIFDGAALISNFESLNPANTFWSKPYNVYAKVDSEATRFLDFETWWGQAVLLNAQEMQWIADELFVGNRLSSGDIRASDGTRIDLHNINSPIVVFCSWGDDITPPQQALAWITDLFDTDDDVVANGQPIVYSLHPSVGHLGIFVSGRVAAKEHDKFVNGMNAIDLLPPGLYEAVITEEEGAADCDLVHGHYVLRFEGRTLADIRALGNNDAADERRFETVARLSEINKALYQAFLSPVVKAMTTQTSAEALRLLHVSRLRYKVFSSGNPVLSPVREAAQMVREHRAPVSQDNIFLGLERAFSDFITTSLNSYGRLRDMASESLFLNMYGSPLLQALVGLNSQRDQRRGSARELTRELAAMQAWAEAELHLEEGTPLDAVLRALLYIYRTERVVDERAFAIFLNSPELGWDDARPSIIELRRRMREQFMLVYRDEERAIDAMPSLLPSDAVRRKVDDVITRIVGTRDNVSAEVQQRLARVRAVLEACAGPHTLQAAQ